MGTKVVVGGGFADSCDILPGAVVAAVC
jgi:hypothetical protein